VVVTPQIPPVGAKKGNPFGTPIKGPPTVWDALNEVKAPKPYSHSGKLGGRETLEEALKEFP